MEERYDPRQRLSGLLGPGAILILVNPDNRKLHSKSFLQQILLTVALAAQSAASATQPRLHLVT